MGINKPARRQQKKEKEKEIKIRTRLPRYVARSRDYLFSLCPDIPFLLLLFASPLLSKTFSQGDIGSADGVGALKVDIDLTEEESEVFEEQAASPARDVEAPAPAAEENVQRQKPELSVVRLALFSSSSSSLSFSTHACLTH